MQLPQHRERFLRSGRGDESPGHIRDASAHTPAGEPRRQLPPGRVQGEADRPGQASSFLQQVLPHVLGYLRPGPEHGEDVHEAEEIQLEARILHRPVENPPLPVLLIEDGRDHTLHETPQVHSLLEDRFLELGVILVVGIHSDRLLLYPSRCFCPACGRRAGIGSTPKGFARASGATLASKI